MKIEKKGSGLFLKIIGISSFIVVTALLLLGYLSLYSKQQLALRAAIEMGESKLKGDIMSFERLVAQKYGKMSLKDGNLVDSSGMSISYRYDAVDAISSELGIVATIFIKENNDYRRIATSITTSEGNRAINTFLDSKGKAYATVQNGQEYIGEATIIGKEYITLYKPIFEQGTRNIIGILFIGTGTDSVKQMIKEKSNLQTGISVAIGVVLVILIILANVISIRRLVIKPIAKMLKAFKKISEGDLTERIVINSSDEIGVMVSYFNKLMDTIQQPICKIKTNMDLLTTAADKLFSVSNNLSDTSKKTVNQVSTTTNIAEQVVKNIKTMATSIEQSSTNIGEVASITEQMVNNISTMATSADEANVNANEVASTAKQMSANMNSIATAIEEMSTSIRQISNYAGEARSIAGNATVKSTGATDAMSKLNIAAKEIGHVIDIIKKIADKTNLLALNATIEAASAGAAGKGFAVVAGEIKELANQSSKSADDITNRIEGIQNETNTAMGVIHDVNDIITKINQSIEAIASHVEQQTKASNEISNNISHTNTGANRVATAISEVAKNTNEIAKNVSHTNAGTKRVASAINEVAKSSHEIALNATEAVNGTTNIKENMVVANGVAKESDNMALQVNTFASDLTKIAEDLKEVIEKFKV